MELSDLLEGVDVQRIVGTARREIKGIAYHSRRVGERFLFAAIRGMEFDGHRFIKDALQRGAEVVLLEEGRAVSSATLIVVPNSRRALARVSANFYGHPSSRVKLVGVTGTKGKTTTSYLLESIFHKAGGRVGVIGTINYRYCGKVMPAPNTTPESLDLQRILAEMVHDGVTHVIMEVSSHGLDLDRVWACEFDVGVFTNFASDHLDYHKTLEHYFRSKQKLFAEYLASGAKARRLAVTNADDPNGEAMVEGIAVPVLRYGVHGSSDISAEQARMTLEGLSCRIRTPNGSFDLQSKLVGEYNLYNILAAVTVGIGMGLPLETLKEGVEGVQGISGRLEKVENQRGIYIFVDYAHTRDALEQVLLNLRQILPGLSSGEGPSLTSAGGGKVITVFGCGGDRDRTKRPLMGEVAGRYSDLTVLTSDNPRTEDPIAIMDQVEEGFKTLGLRKWNSREIGGWRQEKGYLFIPDRREAIRTAIRLAQPSDTVLIAGKGHEDYQIIGKDRFPFDDRVEAKRALEEA